MKTSTPRTAVAGSTVYWGCPKKAFTPSYVSERMLHRKENCGLVMLSGMKFQEGFTTHKDAEVARLTSIGRSV
jgi:hypothetical protein